MRTAEGTPAGMLPLKAVPARTSLHPAGPPPLAVEGTQTAADDDEYATEQDEIARALPCFRVVMEQDAREPLIAQLLAALGDAFEGVDEHYRALVVLKRLLSATAPGDACRALHVRIAWCVRAVANTRAHVRRSC